MTPASRHSCIYNAASRFCQSFLTILLGLFRFFWNVLNWNRLFFQTKDMQIPPPLHLCSRFNEKKLFNKKLLLVILFQSDKYLEMIHAKCLVEELMIGGEGSTGVEPTGAIFEPQKGLLPLSLWYLPLPRPLAVLYLAWKGGARMEPWFWEACFCVKVLLDW